MRPSVAKRAALLYLLAMCRQPAMAASVPPDATALFPMAQSPVLADKSLSVRLPAGPLALASFRFAPKPGQSRHPNAMWCGLTIRAAGGAADAVVTIGRGDFETLSCDGLTAAGVMPAKGAAPRIGLIYRTRSPNFASTTPVVLIDDPASGWRVDESVDEALDALTQTTTLPLMRRALSR